MSERQIQSLLAQIEKVERQALELFGAADSWEPPAQTFLEAFHSKYDDSYKKSHPVYYRKAKEFALKQEVSILKTQLKIAKESLKKMEDYISSL